MLDTNKDKRLVFLTATHLQLTSTLLLLSDNPHLRPAVAQTYLTPLDRGHEPNLLEVVTILIPHPPDLRHQRIPRLNRASESGGELFDVRRVRGAQQLEQPVACHVKGPQAVHDGSSEAHLLARLRFSVERVVVAIQTVQMR